MSTPDHPAPAPAPSHVRPVVRPLVAWAIMLGLGLGIWLCDVWLGLRPARVDAWGWRLLAVFVPTILGLMLRPLPGGALVLLAMTVVILVRAVPPPPGELKPDSAEYKTWVYAQALGGYANDSVWLVLAAYFMARGLIKTGLARRIALTFVRLLGGNTLGLSYALVASDTVLAGMIPSNAARVGGVVLPVSRSLAELYRSLPGPTAGMLGSYLMLVVYQADVVACALFLTGQASNPLAARQAGELTGGAVELHYANWFLYALAPALVSLLAVPWLIYKLCPPAITRTPEAPQMARRQLDELGPMSRSEWIMLVVFLGVCLAWIVTGFLVGPQAIALVALGGAAVLFLTGVITWDDAISEKGAWDVFLWYGGLVQMGTLLNKAKVVEVFAGSVADGLGGLDLRALFLIMLLVYFYAHYGFASITAHILSMYPAFVGVLLARGAPPWLTVCVFAYFANLCAGLTHYGTTPAPIVFGTGYVSHATWWRIGLVASLLNVSVWLLVGLPWWKLWGLW